MEATCFSHLNVFCILSCSQLCWFFFLPNVGRIQHLFLPSTLLPSDRSHHHLLSCRALKTKWTNFVFLPLVLLASKKNASLMPESILKCQSDQVTVFLKTLHWYDLFPECHLTSAHFSGPLFPFLSSVWHLPLNRWAS